jgi:hypothetical protein
MEEGTIQRSLVMVTNPWMVVISVLLLLATAILGFWAWRRSGWLRSIGLLEILRFVCVLVVAITLNQPEWRERYPPQVNPEIAVLWDDSASMDTRDSVRGTVTQSRRDSIAPWIAPEAWKDLQAKFKVTLQPFSPKSSDPGQGSDLNAALESMADRPIPPAAVVLLSDGDWNLGGSPDRAATKLRLKETPVFAVPVGSEVPLPDLAITRFDVPAFAVQGKAVRLPYEVKSTLPRDQTVQIRFLVDDAEVSAEAAVIPAMGTLDLGLTFRPEKAADYRLRVEVSGIEAEAVSENNVRAAKLAVRPEELKVLVIEAYPRWEYRYLRNALDRDPGVEVACLLYHPDVGHVGEGKNYLRVFPPDEDLVDFDVVLLGDVGVAPGQLTADEAERIAKLVRNQASGLIFLPGLRGNQFSFKGSALEELYPVVLDPAQPRGWGSVVPGRMQLTELGQRSLLTRLEDSDEANLSVWDALPGFQWYAPILRAKAGTEILARHGTDQTDFGRVPLIVTKTYGAGKVLLMGTDGAWRWRKGVEDKYHYRFWGQVARWMAYQRNMAHGERMRLFYSPDRPKAGDVLSLNANVMSPGGEPLQEANVQVELLGPSGATSRVRLLPGGEDSWGLFSGRFTATEAGEYKVRLTCVDEEQALETTLLVEGDVREKIGQPARPAVLDEIARITRGKVIEASKLAEAVAALQSLPEPPAVEHRVRLWSHWAWMLLLIVLLTAFWIGRKSAGVV